MHQYQFFNEEKRKRERGKKEKRDRESKRKERTRKKKERKEEKGQRGKERNERERERDKVKETRRSFSNPLPNAIKMQLNCMLKRGNLPGISKEKKGKTYHEVLIYYGFNKYI